jgi:hypothetical protein
MGFGVQNFYEPGRVEEDNESDYSCYSESKRDSLKTPPEMKVDLP